MPEHSLDNPLRLGRHEDAMTKKTKSQWDFAGELFPAEQTRRVLSVAELTTTVRRLLEQHVGQVWVGGEISNFRAQSSGHCYFTLKDASAQLACVLFRGEATASRALLQDGQKVVVQGELTVYEARGQYQLIVRQVEMQGVGALQQAFERLKQKLQAEGLFAPERKRPLPRFPQRIGIVTSPTGAAIRDVLHVIQRRHPGLEIILASCRVQGDGAAADIAASIRLLNEFNQSAIRNPQSAIDLILVTRGGGSLEDLWAFNEEVVARAIFESALPVVSAVGHEIDFTISDFVADVRAATPSAAAEIITEGAFASRQFLAAAVDRFSLLAHRQIEGSHDALARIIQRLRRVHPRRELEEKLQYLDDLQIGLLRCARQGVKDGATAWANLRARLLRLKPATLLAQRRQSVRDLGRRLHELARHGAQNHRAALVTQEARLRLLSPENVLARGYSITMDAASGRVIRAAREVSLGQKLRTRLADGEVRSEVSG
jgi:exodeoxyribonuclease VII large subunit